MCLAGRKTPLTVSVRWHSAGLLLRGAGGGGVTVTPRGFYEWQWPCPWNRGSLSSTHTLKGGSHVMCEALMYDMYVPYVMCLWERIQSRWYIPVRPPRWKGKQPFPQSWPQQSMDFYRWDRKPWLCPFGPLIFAVIRVKALKLFDFFFFFGHCAGIPNERDQSKEHWALFRVCSSVQLWRVPRGKFRLSSISPSIASKALLFRLILRALHIWSGDCCFSWPFFCPMEPLQRGGPGFIFWASPALRCARDRALLRRRPG